MSIVADPLRPHKYPEPPRSYPPWLAAQLRGENVPVPEAVLEKYRFKPEAWMRRQPEPGKILFAHEAVPALYVPPPQPVRQKPLVTVKFRVLSISDTPIFGYSIRANQTQLLTDEKGEASLKVYQGHDLSWSTGRESGWTIPAGKRRRLRMTGMIPLAQTVPIEASTTILLFPESGEFRLNGQTRAQLITYTTS